MFFTDQLRWYTGSDIDTVYSVGMGVYASLGDGEDNSIGGFRFKNGAFAAEAVIVAPMQYSQILWAVVFGAAFFDEWPDGVTLFGAAIIIASGVYIVLREGGGGASENTPVLRNRSRYDTAILPRISTLLQLFARRTARRD